VNNSTEIGPKASAAADGEGQRPGIGPGDGEALHTGQPNSPPQVENPMDGAGIQGPSQQTANSPTRDSPEAGADSRPLSEDGMNPADPAPEQLGAPSFASLAKGGKPRTPTGPCSEGRRGLGILLKAFLQHFLRDLEVLTSDLGSRGSRQAASGDSYSGNAGSGVFAKAFLGLFLRDLRVLLREFHVFLARVGMQPLLFLFVFTFILPRMGGANLMATGGGVDFGTILLPGLMAVAIMFSGIAAVALPLSQEFGVTREIVDRVMCPLPLWAVALEKVCFSAMQSIIGALLVIPMAYYVPAAPVRIHVANWFLLALVLVLSSLLTGSLGLVIGSTVNPRQIGLVFSILVVPITFLGCVYYPWANLGKSGLVWIQIGVLFNPIVYMSEGLRAAITPDVAHMPVWAILLALVFFTAALGRWGLRGFLGRVLS
jgi:ABC-2 type transport system permease protein